MSDPANLEEMLSALYLLEVEYPKFDKVPYERSIAFTHKLMFDICERIIHIEHTLKGIAKNEH